MTKSISCDLAVLGSGPGGYTAAFRAADLGKRVVLIEKEEKIGGVCLNVGCIPSKTLLHVAEIISDSRKLKTYGLKFASPEIDIDRLRARKDEIVDKLTQGLRELAKARDVTILNGRGRFADSRTINVELANSSMLVSFKQAIIAVGSKPVALQSLPKDDMRIWDSSKALELPFVPKRLAVLGGGIIGLEMAQVYWSLGSEITIIEMLDQLIPLADADLVRQLSEELKHRYKAIHTSTKLTEVKSPGESLIITLEGEKAPSTIEADAILVSVGRSPNGRGIGAEDIGIAVDKYGFISVNRRQETNVPGIYAIGDVVGNPMLAHKAVYEGRVAAEAISGLKSANTAMTIPSVAYTDPEVAWTGYTEKQAKMKRIAYTKGIFPWPASGRALSADKSRGSTKAIFDENTGRLIGVGIVGARAGDIIAEANLAIEMGADAADISGTIHPHPTFAETLAQAAEMAEGTITDAIAKKTEARK